MEFTYSIKSKQGKMSRLFVFLGTLAYSILSFGQEGLSTYLLGAGDNIQVKVFGHDRLTTKSKLSDAGTLSFPLLGELQVLGLTAGELEAKIASGLQNGYLLDPKVTVTILSYREIYVEGEVVRPGSYGFQPGLTVRKAISLAQGFTEFASRKKIYVISENAAKGKPRKAELDTLISPGDIITVQESFF